MEVGHNTRSTVAVHAEGRAVIVKVWLELGKPSVDGGLLKTIQARLAAAFGNSETAGPATIARVLADEGAELKHPEIIETDAEWRQARMETSTKQLETLPSAQVLTLETAEKFIDELEQLRKQYELNRDRQALALRTIGAESRRLAEAIARNGSATQAVRVEQTEIAEWLKVWLQTPALFKDWLELRRRSDEFRTRFLETGQ